MPNISESNAEIAPTQPHILQLAIVPKATAMSGSLRTERARIISALSAGTATQATRIRSLADAPRGAGTNGFLSPVASSQPTEIDPAKPILEKGLNWIEIATKSGAQDEHAR